MYAKYSLTCVELARLQYKGPRGSDFAEPLVECVLRSEYVTIKTIPSHRFRMYSDFFSTYYRNDAQNCVFEKKIVKCYSTKNSIFSI
jgi:hypothetical protein